MKGINRKNIFIHLLEKQLNIVERTIFDALLYPKWRDWRITTLQEERFKKYAISIIKGTLKCNRLKAEKAYSDFKETHGLTIKN